MQIRTGLGCHPAMWLTSLGVEKSRTWSASHGCWWGHQMLSLENPGRGPERQERMTAAQIQSDSTE